MDDDKYIDNKMQEDYDVRAYIRYRRTLIIIAIIICITSLCTTFIFFFDDRNLLKDVDAYSETVKSSIFSNSFSVEVNKDKVIFYGNNVDKIYVKYGKSNSVSKDNCDFSFEYGDDMTCAYNSVYTATCWFDDGTKKTGSFEINKISTHVTIKTSGSKFSLSADKGYTIESVKYAIGEHMGENTEGFFNSNGVVVASESGYYTFYYTVKENSSGNVNSYYSLCNITVK